MKLLKASKILHLVVLLCCFLPAIIPTCGGPTKEEIEAREKAVQDSIIEAAKADTLRSNVADSFFAENKRDTIIIDTAIVTNADSTLVERAKDTSTAKKNQRGR